jgi:hypothetical protein
MPEHQNIKNLKTSAGYIWLQTDSQSNWLWKDLAHELARRTGLRPVLLVKTEQDRKFYQDCFGRPLDAESAVVADYYSYVLDSAGREKSDTEIYEHAKQLETKYDINFARSMILADRHLGRGYIVGGKGNPTSSVSAKASHRAGLEACIYSLEFYEALAERFPPELIVCNFGGGGISGKPQILLAQSRDIPFRALVPGRVGGWLYWAVDEMETSIGLERLFSTLPTPSAVEVDTVQKTLSPNTFAGPEAVAMLHKSLEWPTIVYRIFHKMAERLYGRVKGYRFARIGYHLPSYFKSLIRARLHWNQLKKITRKDLNFVGSRKIVYFPLQQEPESSTLVRAPYHTNQFAVALEIALSLPADTILIIKEHPWQLGRRPKEFYDAILEMPNVFLVHPNFPSLDIIRKSSVVCSLTGSAIHEAAILGIPAISFHTNNPIRAVEHVHVLTSLKDLEIITNILNNETPEVKTKQAQDGARYMMALDRYCMSFGTENLTHRTARPSETELKMLSDSLLESLPNGACIKPLNDDVGLPPANKLAAL